MWGGLIALWALVYIPLIYFAVKAILFLFENRSFRGFTEPQQNSFHRMVLLVVVSISGMAQIITLAVAFHWSFLIWQLVRLYACLLVYGSVTRRLSLGLPSFDFERSNSTCTQSFCTLI